MNNDERLSLLFTCEHATDRVPPGYRSLFKGETCLLQSHRGWDPGTLALGRRFAKDFSAPLLATDFTRLLIEPNRSLHHPGLFSRVTGELPREEKQVLIDRYYLPHRARVATSIEQLLCDSERVLHIGVHSFTPVWEGQNRSVDIGLLYDPKRSAEQAFCSAWGKAIKARHCNLLVRKNQPYRGAADGLTTALRQQFGEDEYLGIELEVNQRFIPAGKKVFTPVVGKLLIASLKDALAMSSKG